jgi:hypothetical protein
MYREYILEIIDKGKINYTKSKLGTYEPQNEHPENIRSISLLADKGTGHQPIG